MRDTPGNGTVGLVLVSHSRALAEGLADLVSQVSGPSVAIVPVGGAVDGSLGTDGGRVLEALRSASHGAGSVVLVDLGSSVLCVRAALGELTPGEQALVHLADAPLVEGAVAAGVTASTGADATTVLRAAEEARGAAKL